jgi:UDP-2,3-diacylglucosamine pyrophosphatase LpxH
MRKQIDVVVLSDLHLGSYHCKAKELNQYLRSIQPKTLVLNGDIIEREALRKRYFPRLHMEVIQSMLDLTLTGTKIYFVTGNHDDQLRKFSNMSMGPIHLRDKLVLKIKGKTYWIFHGDLLDSSKWVSPTLRFLGKKGYAQLLRLNRWQNFWRRKRGKSPHSLSQSIKSNIDKAQSYISGFEEAAGRLAIKNRYDHVICGHIHQPCIKKIQDKGASVTYMNSGDWVESLTALEYRHNSWKLYQFHELDYQLDNPKLQSSKKDRHAKLPKKLLEELSC